MREYIEDEFAFKNHAFCEHCADLLLLIMYNQQNLSDLPGFWVCLCKG